jgi:membrane protein implicated in regulation of membrane protease activity
MPHGLAAYYRENSPLILGGAAVLYAVIAGVLLLVSAWMAASAMGALTVLFAIAAWRARRPPGPSP